MNWLEIQLDRILNSQVYDQFPDIKSIERNNPKLSNAEFVGQELSNNIEDRRNGFSESQRVQDLWNEEFSRVRSAMKDSLLRKPAPAEIDFGPVPVEVDLGPIARAVLGK